MRWEYSDGGRAASGFKGEVRDCVVRAIAIAAGRDYKLVYKELREIAGRTPRNGVYKDHYKILLARLGFEWVPTMKVGQGCRVHLREDELPGGHWLVVQASRHLVAVKDGVAYDTNDPRRGGSRCVYGYWVAGEAVEVE